MSKSLEPEQLLAALDERMREARGLLGDLQRAVKQVRAVAPQLVESSINEAVAQGLEELGVVMKAQMEKCVNHVSREFDKIEQVFLGTVKPGKPSIRELAAMNETYERLKAWVESGGENT